MSPQTTSPSVQTDDEAAFAALADLASHMLLANTVADRLRLAAHAVQAHLDRPVGVAASGGSGPTLQVVWAAANEDDQRAVLRAAASVEARPSLEAVGPVVRTSVDDLPLAIVDAGTSWVAVVDPPEDGLAFLRAAGDVIASAVATAASTPEEVEVNLVWSAHELRSPLATVRTAIEQAMRTRRASERRRLLEGGLRELELLSDVTESLLRFGPDGTEPDRRAVDLGGLVAEMLADADSPRVEAVCERGVWAIVDPIQFRIAVMNLVRNAQVHTREGFALVRVFREGSRSVVTVEDRGDGVPAELRDRIFDPYVRGQGPFESGKGSGLGLHICKRIIEAHGGNVTIEEHDGVSVFAIDVPWKDEGRDTLSAS